MVLSWSHWRIIRNSDERHVSLLIILTYEFPKNMYQSDVNLWLKAVDFTEKLWGPVATLVKTASFITNTGLDI